MVPSRPMNARSVTKKSEQIVCVCVGGSVCIRAPRQAHREDRTLARLLRARRERPRNRRAAEGC